MVDLITSPPGQAEGVEMEKHTPGPWSVIRPRSDYEKTYGDRSIMAKNQVSGCPIYIGRAYNNIGTNVCANARLISAAPDLLEAAEVALRLIKDTWIEEHGHREVGLAWGALEAAIAKARGEA